MPEEHSVVGDSRPVAPAWRTLGYTAERRGVAVDRNGLCCGEPDAAPWRDGFRWVPISSCSRTTTLLQLGDVALRSGGHVSKRIWMVRHARAFPRPTLGANHEAGLFARSLERSKGFQPDAVGPGLELIER